MTEDLHFVHVTCVTHNSRVSERMVEFCPPNFLEGLKSRILDLEEQLKLARQINDSIQFLALKVITFNILPDHIHIVMCLSDETELTDKIKRLKSFTDKILRDKKGQKLWAQKFNREWIKDDDQLSTVIAYVEDNHEKHVSQWGMDLLCGYHPEFIKIRASCCTSIEDLIS